jgi:hypothetical protein
MRYEKWYHDLVADDGSVCIAYDSRLELCGVTSIAGGVELYTPDGGRHVRRSQGAPRRSADGAGVSLELELEGGHARLWQSFEQAAFVPSAPQPCSGLGWRVGSLRARCRAELSLDGERRSLSGVGYNDHVLLERPTRRLGLLRLDWGRAHSAEESWVFNSILLEGGARWQRLCRWSEATGMRESSSFSLCRSGAELTLSAPAFEAPLVLRAERVLHVGDAIDRERFPRRLERGLTRLLTGPALERRTLCSVAGDGAGWALEEQVLLGSHAAGAARWGEPC